MNNQSARSDQAAPSANSLPPGSAPVLRKRAEEIEQKRSLDNIAALSPEEISLMLHELKVHQIELEIQNEELRRAQMELDASGARYVDFYNLAPVGYFTISEKGLIIEANLTAAIMLDVVRKTLTRQPMSRYIFKESLEIFYLHLNKIFETATPQMREMQMLKNDGTTFWAKMDGIVAQDADGAPVSRIVMSDISEIKRTEAMLKERENFLHVLLNAIASPVFFKDRAGLYQGCNRAFETFFGETREWLTGKDVFAINPPELAKISDAKDAELFSQGGTQQYEARVKNAQGQMRDVIFNKAVFEDSQGVISGLIGVVLDITARKQMEEKLDADRTHLEGIVEDKTREHREIISDLIEEISHRKRTENDLRESETRYRELFEKASEGIMLLSTKGEVITVNQSFAHLHGYGVEEFQHVPLTDLNVRLEPHVFAERMNSIMAGKSLTFEVEHRHKAGHTIFLEVTSSMVELNNERYLLNFHRDITEKRMLEERVRRNEHLASLGQISAGIAHEINNPNNIIMGNSELLRDVWHDADHVLSEYHAQQGDFLLGGAPFSEMRPKIDNMLKRIFNGSERINAIVNGMKQYTSRMNKGHTEKVAINDVVLAGVEMVREQIGKRTDAFSMDLGENLPLVNGNGRALEEVITNLVSNALQSLAVRTKRVSITTRHDQNKFVVCEVRDEGAGMTPEVLRQATNPFFTTKQNSGGMGLGLSISQSIINNHQGSIDFESRPGQGTVATVRLPVG